jgi:hypothetical protein
VNSIIAIQDFLHPQISVNVQALFRMAYGVLLLGTLLWTLPQWRRFFVSERWGGYAKSSRDVDVIQNPYVSPVVAAVWFLCAALITLGWWSVWAALLNLLLCRYFFVRMRWRGVLRGMGAPGFMSYWMAAAVFLLEFTLGYAPQLHQLTLLVLQVDFAFIMLSAGIYKLTAGYARNHGMEGGMVNPEWGYWWRFFARRSPHHWIFKILNQLAWTTEVVSGILMLIPQTRFIGALLILFSFIFIATQIRLGLLCEMVIVCCLLFFHPGSLGDQLAAMIVPASSALMNTGAATAAPAILSQLLSLFLWAYLILLPLAHAGLFYNFYGRRRLPAPLQRALEIYTNFFGLIIWRVFSVDVVNFFIRIHRRRAGESGGERTLLTRYGLTNGLRYAHVGESITVTSLFTTLKYYPSDNALFRERLLRYARTVACPPGHVLDFEYVSVCKAEDHFDFVTVAEYEVDPAAGTIEERILNEVVSVRAAHAASPVHEGVRPGSYVPLKG